MANFREDSKINWQSGGNIESINAGSLQRIADATELMASNYRKLQSDIEMYKRWYNEATEEKNRYYKKITAMKGVITKMKKSVTKTST